MLAFLRKPLRRTSRTLCEPAFDQATWLTRARRSLAAPAGSEPETAGWDLTLPGEMRARAAGACAGLDALVANLSPPGSGDVQAIDLTTVDQPLAEAFTRMNVQRRRGDVTGARDAGAAALARLGTLAGNADAEALARAGGLSDDRSVHLASALGRRDPFEGRMPSGTLAYAAGSLEALAFRLALDGMLGARAVPAHPWTGDTAAPPFPYGSGRPSYARPVV